MEENTRVFVSGLPPTLTNDDLRKHFGTRFPVTDAHVISKRRIGFVGFKDHNLAQDAVDYFNKTYIRMSKIVVQLARPVDADPIPVTGSRGSRSVQDTSNDTTSNPSLKRKHDLVGKEDDPKLQEYLAAMQPAMKSRTWADDAAAIGAGNVSADKATSVENVADADQVETPQSKPKRLKSDRVLASDSRQQPESQKGQSEMTSGRTLPLDPSSEQPVDEDTSSAPREEAKTDDDWLRSRTSRLLDLAEDEDEDPRPIPPRKAVSIESDESDRKGANKPNTEDMPAVSESREDSPVEVKPFDPNLDMIRNTGRLFVRNLPYHITEKDLEPVFSPFGKVEELHVAFDTRHDKSKGFAYVQYADPESAIQAYEALDGKDFQGRLLHVLPASTKKTYKLDDYEISKLPLKKQQQIKRKQEAASSTWSWNSLYMNADAVMASVAERLGVEKSQLLDPTSSDAAVKQAHAETHVIQETKAYFTANGVNVDSFTQRERGNTAILVKNFSYGVKVDDLRSLFEPYGQITRLLMPPSGTIAIVQFSMPDEAQKAFKGLAYRKIGDSILFLEKAPKDLFEGASTAPVASTDGRKVISQGFSTSDTFKADEVDETALATSTLFVRNLNFSTTTSTLTDIFSSLDGFMSAKVKTKADAKRPGETLSMGFGFVEFKSNAQAQAALKVMNGYKLEQHELVVKASHKGMDAAEQRRREDTAKKINARRTKIIVKNLPFQATKKDIRSLFSAYGQLRSVRVPQKFDRTARGFAFADFVSAREAENAMDALKDTHLLGRRLVLQFADDEAIDAEEEIAKIEKKMDTQVNRVNLQKLTSNGRKKFNVGGDAEDGDAG
ncbi:hypothetical protein AJ80_06533 [Polytolypa hystricis UAMH7299]|uniref:Multiple RNA-binding domain-containing protein 1 n=1 Tax=Polytolypa hystricis (strain UAMH7299) TaxID=1447883 RepID=A0A2B7XWJ7_POLH7|nr:hypothetical protein AJ80_06533 [Polytolypa hystricis UAMH7299]